MALILVAELCPEARSCYTVPRYTRKLDSSRNPFRRGQRLGTHHDALASCGIVVGVLSAGTRRLRAGSWVTQQPTSA
jgi:hypothetical protein